MGGISSIALAYFFNAAYQAFLSKNSSVESFDFSTAQGYAFWISTLASVGWIVLIISAISIVLQKSSRDRWHRWYRLLAAGFLLSVAWAIVGASMQTFTGDVLFWLGYQKPSNDGYSQLEQLLQANDWQKADELTSRMIRKMSGTPISNYRLAPTLASLSRLPCSDFQAIDRLWVKHSNDRFGFSVQRRIYENINIPETQSDRSESSFNLRMNTFLKQVERDDLQNPKFNLDDPIGSLPSLGIWLSTPFSSIQLFSTDESIERQKWCGF